MRGPALALLSLLLTTCGAGASSIDLDAGGAPLACQHLASDEATLACLQQQPPASAAHIRALLEGSMQRGQWRAAAALAALSKQRGLDVSNTVSLVAGQIRRELQALSDSIGSQITEGIAPAYEWAQSVDQVFLQVKWAHKLDAPATLGCEPSAPVFAERLVTFSAECREKRKAFALQLPLFAGIDAAACSWGNASVGRAFVTLQKAGAGPWQRLLSSASRPANQHIWWAMKENHVDELEAWRSPTPTPAAPAPAAAATPSPSPTPSPTPPPASGAGTEAPPQEQAQLPPLRSLL